MPRYTQYCFKCNDTVIKISKIADRDDQYCDTCKTKMTRKMDVPGMVWSPTKNGGHS